MLFRKIKNAFSILFLYISLVLLVGIHRLHHLQAEWLRMCRFQFGISSQQSASLFVAATSCLRIALHEAGFPMGN
jgi:hypothetical protein